MSDFQEQSLRIAQLAGRQYGHVTRRQLLEAGLDPATLQSRVESGRLVRIHQGVYALGYRRVEPPARALAAVLACGPRAVLSHDSALALWGLRRWPAAPEVIAPRCVRRAGIVAHRSRTLTDADTTVQLGVPVTRVARAITDMGRRLTDAQRIRLTNDARLKRILAADEAHALLGHRRNATRSGNEDAFQAWLERHRLPQPIINARLAGHEVAALYPEERVIVEVDDYATHGDPATFASDRERDTAHAALGYRTVRLIRERLTAAEAGRLRRILAG